MKIKIRGMRANKRMLSTVIEIKYIRIFFS